VAERAPRGVLPEQRQHMKRVIFQMSVSLDGSIEGPNHEIDWHLVDDEFNAYAVETLKASAALIMGRRTYELMARCWPTGADNVGEVARLKHVPGDGLLPVGGSELAACLLEQGLIDELRIIHTPIPFPAAFIYSI
jgi:dihydrofolate reductase